MKIVINGFNLTIGGGVTVGKGILEGFVSLGVKDEIFFILPDKEVYNIDVPSNIHLIKIPSQLVTNYLFRILLKKYITWKIKKISPDVIFCLSNYALPLKYKQLLMLQWPYAVYPESLIWSQMSFCQFLRRKIRLYYLNKNLKYASIMTVQTEVMKKRVMQFLEYSKEIKVVPSGVNVVPKRVSEEEINQWKMKRVQQLELPLFLCVSEYYVHKNIEILVDVALCLKEKGIKCAFILTLEEKRNPSVQSFFERIVEHELSAYFINLGRIDANHLNLVYQVANAFILPTLLETYGIIYKEAQAYQLPILTSNLDFAQELNGDNALYFTPTDANDIARQVSIFINQKMSDHPKVVPPIKQWKEVVRDYHQILRELYLN